MEQLQPLFAEQTTQEGFMNSELSAATRKCMRTPYVLRRVPEASFSSLLSLSDRPRPGDVALAQLEKIGRNASLELSTGRRCSLHEGDVLAVWVGKPTATSSLD